MYLSKLLLQLVWPAVAARVVPLRISKILLTALRPPFKYQSKLNARPKGYPVHHTHSTTVLENLPPVAPMSSSISPKDETAILYLFC